MDHVGAIPEGEWSLAGVEAAELEGAPSWAMELLGRDTKKTDSVDKLVRARSHYKRMDAKEKVLEEKYALSFTPENMQYRQNS